MMQRRLVIPRLPEGSVPPLPPLSAETPVQVARPSLAALRLVFGVGSNPDQAPSETDFHPVYTVAMPVVSAGGLDPDGVYEFDAGAQLALLQRRATRRTWALRLELELAQSHDAVNTTELWIESPPEWPSGDGPRLLLLGPARGVPLPGGGRVLTIATTLVHTVEGARALGGRLNLRLADADPRGPTPATIESPTLEVALDLRCYEFEAETDSAQTESPKTAP